MPWAGVGEWITPVGKAAFWLEFTFQCEQGKWGTCMFPFSQPVKLWQETGLRYHSS